MSYMCLSAVLAKSDRTGKEKMEASFWHGKWERGDIGFHTAQANPLLVQHFAALKLPPGSRIFLPLCGKTLDMHWLLERGLRISGIDLSELAVRALFEELGLTPEVRSTGDLLHFQAEGIDLFTGDFFRLSPATLGAVDAVYDRAALVALPDTMRQAYTQHLRALTQEAPQLLIAYEYDQSAAGGPPFSVQADEVALHYAGRFNLVLLDRQPVEGGLKGKLPATEAVWLLTR